MTTLTALLVSRNKHSYLAATLQTLARQTEPPDEILVIDDASEAPIDDPTGIAQVIRREPPAHLQAARNLGLALATGNVILLLDDDGLLPADFVARHRQRHEQEPGHLVVGSVRRVEYIGEEEFWRLPPLHGVSEHRTFEKRMELLAAGVPPWNFAPCSNHVSVAREALLAVGGYEEEYYGWGVDDVDLTYRLLEAGVPLLLDAEMLIYHQEHPYSEATRRQQEQRNLHVFARRHGFWPYGTPPLRYRDLPPTMRSHPPLQVQPLCRAGAAEALVLRQEDAPPWGCG